MSGPELLLPWRCFCVGHSSLKLHNVCCKESVQIAFLFLFLSGSCFDSQKDNPHPLLLLHLSKHFCCSNLPFASMWLRGDSDQQTGFFCGIVLCLISRLSNLSCGADYFIATSRLRVWESRNGQQIAILIAACR